jgi:hypothetical protein
MRWNLRGGDTSMDNVIVMPVGGELVSGTHDPDLAISTDESDVDALAGLVERSVDVDLGPSEIAAKVAVLICRVERNPTRSPDVDSEKLLALARDKIQKVRGEAAYKAPMRIIELAFDDEEN